MTHIFISKLISIGSHNSLLSGRRQATIWTNAGILLIRTLGTNFSELLSEVHIFSFKKMHMKMLSGICRPFCVGLNVLMNIIGMVMEFKRSLTTIYLMGSWMWWMDRKYIYQKEFANYW